MHKASRSTFPVENVRLIEINHELAMTLMQLNAIIYFNRLTALIHKAEMIGPLPDVLVLEQNSHIF